MQTNPFLGVGLHAIGAFSAASCYTPQKKTKLWSWEIYWVTQASFGWLILPIVVAFLTIPNYLDILCDTSLHDAMLRSFLYSVLYGFGGLMFGLGIRYIGFSLNYTIAIGISAGLGTLAPLVYDPNEGFVWKIVEKFNNVPGQIVLGGILLSLVGILLCGWAGALRDRSAGSEVSAYSFKKGVPLAIMAGILSAVFAYALGAGDPLMAAAEKAGAKGLLAKTAVYPFSHGGAWLVSLVWCMILIARNRTGSQFVRLPEQSAGRLPFYYLMALLSGAFWYFQFFFYGMGQAKLSAETDYSSWALHMAMLILFSNVYGKLFREWEGTSLKVRQILNAGMLIIIISTLIIAYGNILGEKAPRGEEKRSRDQEDIVVFAPSIECPLFRVRSRVGHSRRANARRALRWG